MKRLILVQNDLGGTGKSTLTSCFQRYLDSHRVPHLAICISENGESSSESIHSIALDDVMHGELVPYLNATEMLLVEVDTGLAEAVTDYLSAMPSLGQKFELMVVVPVTGDAESFEAVIHSARTFSDRAQYAVVHMPTGSEYGEDEAVWEHSKAARLMDLLDGVDVEIPAVPSSLATELHSIDLELAEALQYEWIEGTLDTALTAWSKKLHNQLDATRKYVFGEAFRPTVSIASIKGTSRRKGVAVPMRSLVA